MTRFAVLRGTNHYFNLPGNDLSDTIIDAQMMNAFLLSKLGFVATPGTYTILMDATKAVEMATLTAMFKAAQPGDYLFYWASGHGLLTALGEPAMACADIRVAGNDFDPDTYILHTEIHDLITGLPPGALFEMGADTCHSGGMERQLGRTYARSKFLSFPGREDQTSKALLDQPLNGILLAACEMGQTAASTGTGGAFTKAVFQAYQAGISRTDLIAGAAKIIAGEGYPQVPELQGEAELLAKPFGVE